MRAIVVIGSLLMAAVATAGPLPDEPHVYVEGKHTETVDPDRFSVRVSISEVAPTSSKAAAAVSERLKALLGKAQKLGVLESQIQAFEIRIKPETEWSNSRSKIVGTRVTREIEFSLHKIEALQELMDALVESDVAAIENMEFSSSQESELRRKSVEQAVLNAKVRGERIANSLGAKLGKVFSVSEFEEHHRPMPLFNFSGYAPAGSIKFDRAGAGPFKPGPIEIIGRVYVVFYLKQ